MKTNDSTIPDEGQANTRPESSTVFSPGTAFETNDDDQFHEDIPVVKGNTILGIYNIKTDPIVGGMGRIFCVHHINWNVDLAMKQPKRELFETETQKKEFVHECEAWINLGLHPHIVSCYYVRDIDNTLSIFSEWMDGGNLKDYIKNGELYKGNRKEVLEHILDISIQFARGLYYAHEQKLIHQDVKPENLLMTSGKLVKVADFGIANARAKFSNTDTVSSGSETIVANGYAYTLLYYSPEQKAGKELTRRTDIWSWAVSVLEMFVGECLWPDGVVAGMACEYYFKSSKVAIPETIKELLRYCFKVDPDKRPYDFKEVEDVLLQVYYNETGKIYLRPVSGAVSDTAGSLNNKALSYIDLGKFEEAEKCWKEALIIEPYHLDTVYNQGLYLWRKGQLDDFDVLGRLKNLPENNLWRARYLEALIHMERGDNQKVISILNDIESADNKEIIYGLLHIVKNRERVDPLVQEIQGVDTSQEGNLITMSHDESQVLVYSSSSTKFSMFEVETGRLLYDIPDDESDSEYELKLGCDNQYFWCSGPEELMQLKLPGGEIIRTFEDTGEQVWSFSLSAGEEQVMTFSHTYQEVGPYSKPHVKLWSAKTGQLLTEIKCMLNGRIYLSPGAGYFMAKGVDKNVHTIEIWSVRTKAKIIELAGHTQKINSLDVSSDYTLALSSSADLTFRLWDIRTGKCLKVIKNTNGSEKEDLRILPGNKYALIINNGILFTIKIIDLESGRIIRSLGEKDKCQEYQDAVCVGDSGNKFAVVRLKGPVEIWKIPDFYWKSEWSLSKIIQTSDRIRKEFLFNDYLLQAKQYFKNLDIPNALTAISSAREVPGFKFASEALNLYHDIGKYCRIKSLKNCVKTKSFKGHTDNVCFIAVSPNGLYGISGCGDRSADKMPRLWDMNSGEWIEPVLFDSKCCCAGDFSPDGRFILVEDYGSIYRFEIKTGMVTLYDGRSVPSVHTKKFKEYKYGHWAYTKISYIKYHPGGKYFIVLVEESRSIREDFIQIWNLDEEQPINQYKLKYRSSSCIDLSPDGNYIALGGSGEKTVLKEFRTFKNVKIFHYENATSLKFSPDGQTIAMGDKDGNITICPIQKDKGFVRLKGERQQIESLCFSQDGKFIISSSKNGQICIWDLNTQQRIVILNSNLPIHKPIVVSPNNQSVLAGGDDNDFISWYLDWEYEFPGWSDWNEGARPYLDIFLSRYPDWKKKDFEQELLPELQLRGYGWLRTTGVKEKLRKLTVEYQGNKDKNTN